MSVGGKARRAMARDRLRAYFDGSLIAAMGMRSALGGQLEAVQTGFNPSTGGGGDEGPGDAEIEAAGTARRVETALRLLTRIERIVLAAYFTPMPPGAPQGLCVAFGELRGVVVALALESAHGSERARRRRSIDGERARLRRVVVASTHGPWKAGAAAELGERKAGAMDALISARESFERVYVHERARPWRLELARERAAARDGGS